MTTPKLWLTQFLHRRDLRQPDGRMLYAYRLEEQEYAALRDLVGNWLSAGSPNRALRFLGSLVGQKVGRKWT